MDQHATRSIDATANPSDRSRRWVIGLDGSECSRHAALWAVAHASGRTDHLELLSAWSYPVSHAMVPVGAVAPATTVVPRPADDLPEGPDR